MSRRAAIVCMFFGIGAALPAWSYDCPYFAIDLPTGFSPYVKEQVVAGAPTYVFMSEPAAPWQLASMIQISIYDYGDEFEDDVANLLDDMSETPNMTRAELSALVLEHLADRDLKQFLDSLAASRTDFIRHPSERVTVGGFAGRRATWEGEYGSVSEIGFIYAIVVGSRAFLIRAEGDADQLEHRMLPAARAIESMTIKQAAHP